MKKIVWVGLAASEEIYQKLVKKGYFHFAAQEAQSNLIEGIERNLDMPMDMISGFMMPTYPDTREIMTKPYQWRSQNGGEGESVANLNIRYLDALYRTIQMKKACRLWAKRHSEDENIVFVYSAVNAYIKGALEIKKYAPKTKIYLIITDLPQFMELRPSKIKKMLKNLDWHSLNRSIHQCDGWIVFTKHMISYLNLPQKKCLVMEGSVNKKNIRNLPQNEELSKKIIVMYSGSLGLQYGVPELLEAFSSIEDENYELWFTGKGNAEKLIEEYAEKDKRIRNYGFLTSHEELLSIQRKASMLMNMRMPTEKASAYCFPSKMFDYLLAGKPVLSFKIPGVPDEYYKYLIMMKSTKIADIQEAILQVGSMSVDKRSEIGSAGRKFIIETKNNLTQGKKICQFIGLEEDRGNAI